MKDTPPEIEAMVRERLMALSGDTRVKMGSNSFDAAREIILSSFPPGLSDLERRRLLYERTYGEPPPPGALEE